MTRPLFEAAVALLRVFTFLVAAVLAAPLISASAWAAQASWQHLASTRGELPPPTGAMQQTAAVVADFDGDGRGDFVIASRGAGGKVELWRARGQGRFERSLIESSNVQPEAGGAAHDIDGDGDLDLVLGQDFNGKQIFWWENPAPNFGRAWSRRVVGTSPATKHHDQLFADVDDDKVAELVSWNQEAKHLDVFEIPASPRQGQAWARRTIFVAPSAAHEGLAFADIDLDGKGDLVAGRWWFKLQANGSFVANPIDTSGAMTRVAVGQLVAGGRPEIVLSPGDTNGVTYWYQWNGSAWQRNKIADTLHGHTLEIADLDDDGHQDVLLGEMRLARMQCRLELYRGDGKGGFSVQTIARGNDIHEGKLIDVDADGDLDLVHKPFDDRTPRVDVWLNTTRTLRTDAWARAQVATLASQAVYVRPADLDGDGWADLAAGDSWWRNPAGGSGAWTKSSFAAPLRNVAAIADFDGDGDLDVFGTRGVGSAPNAEFAWAENDGNGRFQVRTNIAPGSGDFLQGVLVRRFSPTGPLEIALSWHKAGEGVQVLSVPSDPKSGTWTWRRISPVSQDEDLSAGDIDGDGDEDLLLGTTWLENPSWQAHSFGRVDDLPWVGGAPTPDRNSLADIDGDGDLDAVVSLENGREVLVFENPRPSGNSKAAWTRRTIGVVAGQGFSMDVGDLDNDGDPDIVVGEHRGSSENRVLLFRNDAKGTSFPMFVLDRGPTNTIDHHDGTQLCDLDVDGDLDIVSLGWTHAKLWVYTNGARTPGQSKRRTTPPLVEPAAATFTVARVVRLRTASAQATIRYTLDGSPVRPNSPVYAGPITITSTTQLRARCYESGLDASVEAQGSFAKLDDDLAQYAFDDIAGVRAQDRGSSQQDAQISSAAFDLGLVGSALRFDGATSRVVLPTPRLSAAMTISAWIRADRFDHLRNQDTRIFSQATGTAEQEHGIMLSTVIDGATAAPRLRLRVGGTTRTLVASGFALAPSQWTNITGTYDGSEMRLYVNGTLAASRAASGPITLLSNAPTWIGDNPTQGQRAFDGLIDEVRVWSRALSGLEILALGRAEPNTSILPYGKGSPSCLGVPTIEFDDDLHASAQAARFTVSVRKLPPNSAALMLLAPSGPPLGIDYFGVRIYIDPLLHIALPVALDASGGAKIPFHVAGGGLRTGTRFVLQFLGIGTASCKVPSSPFCATPAVVGVVLPPR